MSGRIWSGVAAAALAVLAGAARAETSELQFTIGTKSLHWQPDPEYCLAANDAQRASDQMIKAADDQNLTHLVIFACDAVAARNGYVVLKTPKAALFASLTRAELLGMLKEQFGTGEVTMPGGPDTKFNSAMKDMTGSGAALESRVQSLGTDDTCANLAGLTVMTLEATDKPVKAAWASCSTSVGGKIVTVNVYEEFMDGRAPTDLLGRAQKIARQLIAQNEISAGE